MAETYQYRIFIHPSNYIDVQSTNEWDHFVGIIRANGFFFTPNLFLRADWIVAIVPLLVAGTAPDNVVPLFKTSSTPPPEPPSVP